ncbi:MAG: branched-chain amino acid ABC transporter permease [Candidatus Caldarchaeum sp.]
MTRRETTLHLSIIAILFAAQFILPPFHHSMLTRIMVLTTYAIGYNLLLGYTGLMSLGHAMLFSTGLYSVGLTVRYLGFEPFPAYFLAMLASLTISFVVGAIALRTSGVFFLIVTMIFSQVFYLTTLYFNSITYGDQGFVISQYLRKVDLGFFQIDFADNVVKYNLSLLIFSIAFMISLYVSRSNLGLVLAAIRENPDRVEMLGYNTYRYKLLSFTLSGTVAGIAGGMYALVFSYVGSSFAFILNSINPLLWTLLGGTGTTTGPLVGTMLMTYIIDLTSSFTESYLVVVGLALILITLGFPRGIMGTVKKRWLPWLP